MENKMLILWLFSEAALIQNKFKYTEEREVRKEIQKSLDKVVAEIEVLLEGISQKDFYDLHNRTNLMTDGGGKMARDMLSSHIQKKFV
jgi:actin-like ATPase involved in cell morphogenesis